MKIDYIVVDGKKYEPVPEERENHCDSCSFKCVGGCLLDGMMSCEENIWKEKK